MVMLQNEHAQPIEKQPPTKAELLQELHPRALLAEVDAIRAEGYDISFGDTLDKAYEHPEKIHEVFMRLHEGGRAFHRGLRRLTLGSVGLGRALELTPVAATSAIRRQLKPKLRELRAGILYEQPDVQAMAWHKQNGKALALGTIVGAHELQSDVSEGLYEYMSGELSEAVLEHTFSDHASANIAGLTVREALVATAQEFRGVPAEKAAQRADAELEEVGRFVKTPIQQGFKEIVQYCTDSLGIRSRKEEVRQEIGRYVDESEKNSFTMMSVGCGTAQPMLEVMKDVIAKGRQASLILIDQDPIALAAAEELARGLRLPALRLETRIELTGNHATFARWGFVRTAENAHPGFTRITSIEMRKALV